MVAEARGSGVDAAPARSPGGVQSLQRAMNVLELIAANDGVMGLSAMATRSGLALPTIHRIVRTLVDLGYLRQDPSRQYALGPRLLLLADSSTAMLKNVARPHLARLVDEIGETANLAMLDGDQVAYVAQVPSRHSMRMFTEVGKRVMPHCTAVGKALLADTPDDKVQAILRRTGMPRQTEHTITDSELFADHLRLVASNGYAIDDGEQEIGVRCVAVQVARAPVKLAISVSGPAPRMTPEIIERAVPLLLEVGAALASDLA